MTWSRLLQNDAADQRVRVGFGVSPGVVDLRLQDVEEKIRLHRKKVSEAFGFAAAQSMSRHKLELEAALNQGQFPFRLSCQGEYPLLIVCSFFFYLFITKNISHNIYNAVTKSNMNKSNY